MDGEVNLFSRPDTVMRYHLTTEELNLYDDPETRDQIFSTPPSMVAFIFRHWVQTVVAAFLTVVVLIGWSRWASGTGGRITYFVTGVSMVLLGLDVAVLEVRLFFRTYTRYVITPNRILKMDGIVERRFASIEWDKITDTSYQAGIVGQMFDYGDIRIETANESSHFGTIDDVPKPRAFLKTINAARAAKAKTPVSEAALKALIALERLLTHGGLVVERNSSSSEDGWRVRRESA